MAARGSSLCVGVIRSFLRNGFAASKGLFAHPLNFSILRSFPQPLESSLSCSFHTSVPRTGLEEFFDDPKYFGVKEVRTGRSWTKDDLRLKSNIDLHKLWFVLYKEKNMLYTMQKECARLAELFPNPERIDKVEESMKNLECVVNERNKAVKLLEIGITGEPPRRECYSGLGRKYMHTYQEHLMPYWRNAKHFKRRYEQEKLTSRVADFLRKLREKIMRQKYKQKKYQTAILHRARAEYPDDPIWHQGREPNEMSFRDVYHGKMSD